MIYRRSFYREAGGNIASMLLVIGGLTAMVLLGRIIAATSYLPAHGALALLGLQLLKSSPQLLTAAAFGGMLIAFNRMAHSRELAAWSMAGLHTRHWLGATLVMAVPLAATVALLALHAAPWSIRYGAEYQRNLADEVELERTNPGLFGEISGQNLVYHLRAVAPDRSHALGIFIARGAREDRVQLVLADQAQTLLDGDGLHQLDFENGEVHNLDFSSQTASRIRFQAGSFSLSQQARDRSLRLRARAASELGDDAAERTELLWRWGFGPALLLLALLALPLGKLGLSSSRSYQILLALLGYWFFYAFGGYTKELGFRAEMAPALAAIAPLLLLVLIVAGSYLARPGRYLR